MRVLRLNLLAFGPFTEVLLDLSNGHDGVHLIYGPNEAGKSSALRALEQLLFGIPSRSSDDFIHPYANLRIGATLAARDGATLEFFRRKGARGTLLDVDGTTPLEDGSLRPFLSGLDQELFASMFGIGHEQLVQGGQEIASGGGDLGQILFAAGSGIADLQSIRERLEKEAEELFMRRGNRRINQHLKYLDEARKIVRQEQLSTGEWETHEQQLQQAAGKLQEIETQLRALSREKSRLERLTQALPLIAKRADRRRELEGLGDVPRLGSRFAERRRKISEDLAAAQSGAQTTQKELDRVEQQLQTITIPEAILVHAEQIRQLPDLLGGHRKAQRDLPGLIAEREQLQREATSMLRQVRPDLTLEAVETLRLTSSQRLTIQNLGTRCETLQRQIEQARKDIHTAGSQLAESRAELSGLEPPRNVAMLVAGVQRVQEQGKLDEQRATIGRDLTRIEEQVSIDLARLDLWSGSVEELEQLRVPSPETVDRHEAVLLDAGQAIGLLQDRLDDASQRRAEFDRQIEQLRLEGDVPTEDALDEARRVRDEGWQLVLAVWQTGTTDAKRTESFLARFAATDLATAYRQAVEAADELADRLRREAQRVALRAGWQANRDAADQQAQTFAQRLEAAREEHRRVEAAWLECWRPLGIQPQSPREMRVWLRRQAALSEQIQSIRTLRGRMRQIEDQIAACRRDLGQCLAGLDEPAPADHESLAALVVRSRKVVERVENAATRRQTLEKEIRQLSGRLANAQAAEETARSEQMAWQNEWALAIEPLGLPAESGPAVANDVLNRVGELFSRLDEAQGVAGRIAAIHQDADAFRNQVAALARQVGWEVAAKPAEQTADELIAALQKANSDRHQQQNLQQQRDRHQRHLQESRQNLQSLEASLKAMCLEARCSSHEELPEVERKSDLADRLRESLEGLDDQLLSLSGGASLEKLLEEATAIHADDLPGKLAELTVEVEKLDGQRSELQKTVWEEQHTLASMDTSATVADAAQRAQELLAQIQTDAEQYARLRLAAAVLREGIERYQKKNEAPVLRRASELFQRLTLGSFERLSTDYGDQGQKVLVGVRAGGKETVGLAGMSDGTCDQLYLALRLASLETYLADKEPIPFIVDDILVSFDDARSAAALEILAELSSKTQIIFFTHHEHLVHLAQKRLKPDVLFVHELRRKNVEG
jgi:uncharacterized protein YhaN